MTQLAGSLSFHNRLEFSCDNGRITDVYKICFPIFLSSADLAGVRIDHDLKSSILVFCAREQSFECAYLDEMQLRGEKLQ
jgi:hypothetical protein